MSPEAQHADDMRGGQRNRRHILERQGGLQLREWHGIPGLAQRELRHQQQGPGGFALGHQGTGQALGATPQERLGGRDLAGEIVPAHLHSLSPRPEAPPSSAWAAVR